MRRCEVEVEREKTETSWVSKWDPTWANSNPPSISSNTNTATMSSEGNAVATPSVDLDALRTRITTLGETIKTLKSSSEPDKDAIATAVAELLDAKRSFANNNGGIGVDGNKWEEPMSKKDKKKAEKAAKAAAAGGGNVVSEANGMLMCT